MMAMMVSEIGGLAIGQTALMGQKWLVSADSQEFNLEDEGRTARDSGLGEFAVAEPDGQWRAAITRVEGMTVDGGSAVVGCDDTSG